MNFTIGSIENWVANYYGIEVKASVLNGYDELNFLLVEKSGKKNILKVSNSSHDYFFLEAQVKILQYLAKTDIASQFQTYTLNKKVLNKVGINNLKAFVQGNDLFVILSNKYGEDPLYALGTLNPRPKFTIGVKFDF